MDSKDKFFAQNWLEQFRRNIRVSPYEHEITTATDAFEVWDDVGEVLYKSFEWCTSPEHPDRRTSGVWSNRRNAFPFNDVVGFVR